MRNEVAIARSITVMAVLGVIAALYFAKAVFVPLALAILLTFLLAPAVRLLRSWGLPKPPAVVLVVAFAFAVILGLGALVGQQVTKLAQNLPLYQYNIEEKIRSARGFAGGGMLERISNFLADLNQEVGKKHDASSGSVPQPNEELTKPVPVEVHQPAATPMQVAERVLLPLVDPLTTAGLVVIFVIFFLSQRQDLRDRLIRLAGSHDLQRTTDAINDGAQRLSRYFLAQTALNVLFGLIVASALPSSACRTPCCSGFWLWCCASCPISAPSLRPVFLLHLPWLLIPGGAWR
jgi:predicted PurR-regulated permease PerM